MTVSSYTIESAESIIHKSTTAANSASDATAGSVYVEASPAEPYSVYAVSYKDIDGGVAAVDETGVTTEEVQGFQFANESSLVRGLNGNEAPLEGLPVVATELTLVDFTARRPRSPFRRLPLHSRHGPRNVVDAQDRPYHGCGHLRLR